MIDIKIFLRGRNWGTIFDKFLTTIFDSVLTTIFDNFLSAVGPDILYVGGGGGGGEGKT